MGVANQVPDDQEIRTETHRLDSQQLVSDTFDDFWCKFFAPAFLRTQPCQMF